MATNDVPITVSAKEAAYTFGFMIVIDCETDLEDFLRSLADGAFTSLFPE